MKSLLRSLLREPLVHFLLAGGFIFLLFLWRGDAIDQADNKILITRGQVETLTAGFEKTWRRAPNDTERDTMIKNHIREEVLLREATRLGLDQNDPVIRRRLLQKMQFLSLPNDVSKAVDDNVLKKHFTDNIERYGGTNQYSFRHIYFAKASYPDVSLGRIEEAQKQLAENPKSYEGLGDPIPLPSTYANANQSEINRHFGPGFAEQLKGQSANQWLGPFESAYGRHLVWIDAINPAAGPSFDDVRQQVENDWRSQTQRAREEKAFAELAANYDIEIERAE